MVKTAYPVIFLAGNETYLKEKAINELRSLLLDGSSGELDYKLLHGPDTSADEILNCVSTIPFFSSKRLVIVKDFEKLPEEELPKIISYIKNPHQYACLVLDVKDDDILDKEPDLAGYARVMRFTELTDTELSGWITKYLSSKGKTIKEDALEILKELQGQNLLRLSQELEKLTAFTGNRADVSGKDVEALVGKSLNASAFDIADAVSGKDVSRAIGIACDLMTEGKKPYEIIGLLSWHFKRILKAKMLLTKGGSEFSAAQALRVPRRKAEDFFAQVRSFSGDQIEQKMRILLDADLNMKRPKYKPSLIMEFTIIRLCLEGSSEALHEAGRLS